MEEKYDGHPRVEVRVSRKENGKMKGVKGAGVGGNQEGKSERSGDL